MKKLINLKVILNSNFGKLVEVERIYKFRIQEIDQNGVKLYPLIIWGIQISENNSTSNQ